MITKHFVKINTYINFNYRQNGYFTLFNMQYNFLIIYTKQTKSGRKICAHKTYIKMQNKFDFFSLTALVSVFLILNLTLSPSDEDV